MYKHILLPTDGSGLSDKAVKEAIRLAKSIGAKLTAINVTPKYPDARVDEGHTIPTPAIIKKRYYEEAAEGSKKLLDQVKSAASAAGVDCQGVSVPNNQPYDAIIKHAKKADCDLIMMASHGRKGLSGILLGSETTKVLTHSTVPVLVLR